VDGLFHEDGSWGLPDNMEEKKEKGRLVVVLVLWRGRGLLFFFMVLCEAREPSSWDSPQSNVVWRKDMGCLMGYL